MDGAGGKVASDVAGAVLVVNDHEEMAAQLRRRYPRMRVTSAETYLSAVSELSKGPFDAVLAYVDVSQDGLAKAVSGLRRAAGGETRVLLCCRAEAEPLTRGALGSGADDYLIYPLEGSELDKALANREPVGRMSAGEPVGEQTESPTVATEELKALGDVVGLLDAPPAEILGALARLLCTAMGAGSARVVVEGTTQTAGDESFDPEMLEALYRDGSPIGHVAIGEHSSGAYRPSDSQKLRHYATLIGHLVGASLRQRQLYELAHTDELTSLPNRRYLTEFLGKLLNQSKETRGPVTLLMFDIDNFKVYNDKYGHDAGDEIIRGCGQMFRANCREHDVVTRYGGDEFVVVFWDKGGPREAGSHHPTTVLPIIERCRRSIHTQKFERFKLAENARLTISGGLASFPTDATTVESLITRADEALYRAKRDGKNCIYLGGDSVSPALGSAQE